MSIWKILLNGVFIMMWEYLEINIDRCVINKVNEKKNEVVINFRRNKIVVLERSCDFSIVFINLYYLYSYNILKFIDLIKFWENW